jgi:hypothetical protein
MDVLMNEYIRRKRPRRVGRRTDAWTLFNFKFFLLGWVDPLKRATQTHPLLGRQLSDSGVCLLEISTCGSHGIEFLILADDGRTLIGRGVPETSVSNDHAL